MLSTSTLHLKMSIDEPIELEVSSDQSERQISLFVSNSPGTSKVLYCNYVKSNSTGELYVDSPQRMLSYGSSSTVYIMISVDDADSFPLNITLNSRVLSVSGMLCTVLCTVVYCERPLIVNIYNCNILFLSKIGYQNIGSHSNRFMIGMFSNHPDAGYIPITLSISTLEVGSVNFTVTSITGVILEGSIDEQATEILLPQTYVVSSTNETDKGLLVETVNPEHKIALSVSSHDTYSSDSYLAFPLIDYFDVDSYTYYAVTPYTNSSGTYHRVLLVGGYNDTVVTAVMSEDSHVSTDIDNEGLLSASVKYTFKLNEFETILLESEHPLTGSKFVSTKPISFISGHQCAVIPESGNSCDFAIEQYPPTLSWGTEFLFPILASRMGGSYISFVSSVEYTDVNLWCISNTTDVNITDTINFIAEGDYIDIFIAPDDVYCSVVSNNSILVTLIGTSENNDDDDGDPLMMIVPPKEQFYGNVSFIQTSEFNNNFMNILSTTTLVTYNDIAIDNWVNVATDDSHHLGYAAQIQLPYQSSNEVIEVSSEESHSFSVNVYGFNFSVGYGQVAGMNFLKTDNGKFKMLL